MTIADASGRVLTDGTATPGSGASIDGESDFERELAKMAIAVNGGAYRFAQSHIDPSVWSVARGRYASEGGSSGQRARKSPESSVLGFAGAA